MTKLDEITKLGQSIWLDYIRRSLFESGQLQALIDEGLRGMTSNPSIFEAAITDSTDYDEALAELSQAQKSPSEIYEALAIEDIQTAADLFKPIYQESDGQDGYVSLEANPALAYDTKGTIEEARRLFKAVDRPNVMIKIPATCAGIPAITSLISQGININVTLMFSIEDYKAVSNAFLQGLERLIANGGNVARLGSVASFFVSRVDTAVDETLNEIKGPEATIAQHLTGKIGIANAKMAYAHYLTVFSSDRWIRLAALGAHPQRLLWGSTSVKNPDFPDTLYIDNLMGANTINTLPLDTFDALRQRATVSSGLTANLEEARQQLVQLAHLNIDLAVITQQLQNEGVTKFKDAYDSLLDSIKATCNKS